MPESLLPSTEEVRTKLEEIGLDLYPYWRAEYLKNIDRWSKPEYKIRKEKDVYVTVRDNVSVCVDIFRPDIEPGRKERFPAILSCSGYSKDVQSIDSPPVPWDSPLFDHSREAGDYQFFVSRGYVHVIMDARGTGKSGGEFDGPYSIKQQEDCADVIEWIAAQPWCDGNVGMLGMSWYAVIQLLAAEQQPLHLRAIFPLRFCGNLYKHSYNGGITSAFYWGLETTIAVNNPKLVAETEYPTREEFERALKARLEDPDIASNSHYVRVLSAPRKKNTWFADVLLHPLDGKFWQERSPAANYSKIRVPIYMATSWGGDPEMMDGPFDALNDPTLSVPKRLVAFSYHGKFDLPLRELNGEELRFFDHYLKGVENGIEEEPPIKLLVRGPDRFRYEKEWPLARTRWTKFYLRRFGKLSTEQELDSDLPPDPLVHRPPTISTQIDSLIYETSPLAESVEITGPPTLYLHASVDQDDANFIVNLLDAGSDRQQRDTVVHHGYLRASHRTLLNEGMSASQHWKPVHDHTKQVRVEPNVVYEYAIPIGSVSYVFQRGRRIKLEITSIDRLGGSFNRLESYAHLPSSKLTYYKIFRDNVHKSYLSLPVIPESDKASWIS